MRYLVVLLALVTAVAAHPLRAAAEQGYRAKITNTITITSEFDKLLQASLAKKHGKPDSMTELASSLTIDPVMGNLYFTRNKFRVDYTVPQNGMVITTIVDSTSGKYIVVNHTFREAFSMDLAAFSEMDNVIGLPVGYPDQMFCRWQDVLQHLKAISSAKVKDLGSKKVAGESCHGLACSVDLVDVFKADGYTPFSSIAPITDIKGKWKGEFWLSDRLGLPMVMDTNLLGVRSKWELYGIEEWRPVDALLCVPREYKVHSITAAEMIKALSLGQAKP
jgi:hypothetical protein